MLQVTKLETPDPYKAVKDSIKKVTSEAVELMEDEKIIGYCLVVLRHDGTSLFTYSDGIERQRRIGILMDIVHDMCNGQ